jgi:hypothetical protein
VNYIINDIGRYATDPTVLGVVILVASVLLIYALLRLLLAHPSPPLTDEQREVVEAWKEANQHRMNPPRPFV